MKIAFLTDNYMPNGSQLDPFRAQLLKTVARAATELMYIQCNDYADPAGVSFGRKYEDHVGKAIQTFRPDVLFSLNRAGLNQVEAQGQVISWYIDNPNRFPPALQKFGKHEKIYCATRYQMGWLEAKSPSLALYYLPFCTDHNLFRPEPPVSEDQKCDVSFVGTLWDPVPFLNIVNKICETREGKDFVLRGMRDYTQNYNSSFPNELQSYVPHTSATEMKNFLDDFLSSRKRLNVLEALSDLDLEIYGTSSWGAQALLRSEQFLTKFVARPIDTPEDLAHLYRRSRVAVSIAHQQAQSGFPIRIFDILSVGVPLVSDRHSEMDEFFEPGRMYLRADSPAEVSSSVRRLLADPAFAKQIGEAAREEVKAHHTFEKRVESLFNSPLRTAAKVIYLVSERLSDNFLVGDSRFSDSMVKRIARMVVSIPPPGKKEPTVVLRKVGKMVSRFYLLSKLSLSIFILTFKYVFTLAKNRKIPFVKGLEPLAQVGRNLTLQQIEMLAAQMRKLLSEISLIERKTEA